MNLIHLLHSVVITPIDPRIMFLHILHVTSVQLRFQLLEDIHEGTSFVTTETDEVEGISLEVEVRTSLVGLGTIPTEDAPTRIRTSACLLEVRETRREFEDEFFVYIHIFPFWFFQYKWIID